MFHNEIARRKFLELQQSMVARQIKRDHNQPKPRHPVFHCQVCLNEPDDYMVKDEVWALGGKGARFLCFSCLEHRLQRRLTLEDFTPVPCNRGILQGFRMAMELMEKNNGSLPSSDI